MCRSRRELSNAYFLAKFGFDTAENERLTRKVQLARQTRLTRVTVRRKLGLTQSSTQHRGRLRPRSAKDSRRDDLRFWPLVQSNARNNGHITEADANEDAELVCLPIDPENRD